MSNVSTITPSFESLKFYIDCFLAEIEETLSNPGEEIQICFWKLSQWTTAWPATLGPWTCFCFHFVWLGLNGFGQPAPMHEMTWTYLDMIETIRDFMSITSSHQPESASGKHRKIPTFQLLKCWIWEVNQMFQDLWTTKPSLLCINGFSMLQLAHYCSLHGCMVV